jgi:hypothetical protein
MKYLVKTTSMCIATYTVEADSPKQAEERFNDGWGIDEKFIDFKDERIVQIKTDES